MDALTAIMTLGTPDTMSGTISSSLLANISQIQQLVFGDSADYDDEAGVTNDGQLSGTVPSNIANLTRLWNFGVYRRSAVIHT